MVDLISDNLDDDARLFLHGPTGRFRRLRLPVLRDHILLGISDGLFVLGDREPPHLARVLNPFTGDMIHFAAPLPEHFKHTPWVTAVSGGSHLRLYLCRWDRLFCAAQSSDVFTESIGMHLASMVSFQGNIYCVGPGGCVVEFVTPTEIMVIAKVSPDVDVYAEGDDRGRRYLVESAGELLLIRYVDQTMKVFRVNFEHKLLEEVKSLGGNALFLGEERWVSVDADKLPSVDGDCIYMVDYGDEDDMCTYNLRGDMVNIMSSEDYLHRPFGLVQVLSRYCDFHSH